MKNRKNAPFVFAQSCQYEDLGGGVKRRIFAYGDALMQVQVEFETGAIGKMHSHPHSQLTNVLEGVFEFTIGEETRIVRKGDTLYKTPNVPHGCVCLEKGILLDTFSPCREDFLK